jgi:hypothetical protein
MSDRSKLESRIVTGFLDLKTAELALDRRLAGLDAARKEERDSFLWALTILDVRASILDKLLEQLDAGNVRTASA